MRIVRYSHSCVRLESASGAIAIDPGVWSEAEATDDVDAVLVTHGHRDHIDAARFAGSDVPIHAAGGAAITGLPTISVDDGATFTAGGFEITPIVGFHVPVVNGQAPTANVGYLIDGRVFHPGDSLQVPDHPIQLLFAPLHASWLKASEVIAFIKAVAPDRAIGVHDGQLNDRGLHALNYWIRRECGDVYEWLAPGSATTLGGP